MGVESGRKIIDARESGQSLLEFLLMLPMMVGLVVVLIRVNTAIQISIVNQQYARMHALWLTFNSPIYPRLNLRVAHLDLKQDNQMVIGVSDNTAPTEGEYKPVAATSYIARKRGQADKEDKEPTERANVRIRDTVTLCSQPNVVRTQSGYVPILPLDPHTFALKGNYNLAETTRFDYCRSNLTYVTSSEGDGS